MTLLINLKEKFTNENDGPLLNELLNVLHFMGLDEATKAAYCEQVVKVNGRTFLERYAGISRSPFADNEQKFYALAGFLAKSAPRSFQLPFAD